MRTLLLLLLSMSVALASASDEWQSIGYISSIDEISHIHVTNLLLSRGIESVMPGHGGRHWIQVHPDKAAEATSLIRADAPKRNYRVWLANPGGVVGDFPEPRMLLSRIAVAVALRKPEFRDVTPLGRFLRSKEIKPRTTKYPFIVFLRVSERRFLRSTTELGTGYEVELDLQKSLRTRDDDFGGRYQLYDEGKRIESLGWREGTVAKPE